MYSRQKKEAGKSGERHLNLSATALPTQSTKGYLLAIVLMNGKAEHDLHRPAPYHDSISIVPRYHMRNEGREVRQNGETLHGYEPQGPEFVRSQSDDEQNAA